MYYRYKAKKKNNSILKIIVSVVIISGLVYAGNRYKNYLFFWRYSFNKLDAKIAEARSTSDRSQRKDMLKNLASAMERHRDENMTNPDVFFSSGKIHGMIGECSLQGGFSDLLINDKLADINPAAKNEFIRAVKYLHKGEALLGRERMSSDNSLMLAKAGFYSGFKSMGEIITIIEEGVRPDEITDVEDIRFYSMMLIYSGRENDGLKYLAGNGRVNEGVQGKFFLAAAEKAAKKYTDAIMNYKSILGMTKDKRALKIANYDLGKIYFAQSLYRESLAQLNEALLLDPADNEVKLLLGKTYMALGDRAKAKATLSEILATDSGNSEVKKLLGIL